MRKLNIVTLLIFVFLLAATVANVQRSIGATEAAPTQSKIAAAQAQPLNLANIEKLAVPRKTSASFNGLQTVPTQKFVKRQPHLVRADLRRAYPIMVDKSKITKFRTLQFQGRSVNDMENTLKRTPILSLKKYAVAQRLDYLHFVRIYTPQAYPHGVVAIFVEHSLLAPCQAALNRYVEDIASDGYFGFIVDHQGGSVEDLKTYLKSVNDLAGAILVGNIPAAWYRDGSDEFPCDLFLMDLDGVWKDTNGDKKYDSHTGNVEPEIFVARWPVHQVEGGAVNVLNTWLNKNHDIRQGKKGNSIKAVAFVDNDWAGFGSCNLQNMLNPAHVETYNVKTLTTAVNYKTYLARELSWLHFCCHSSPWHHETHDDYGHVTWQDLKNTNPPHAFFQQMFNCSSARFTEKDFLGGYYVFGLNTPHMLAAVGSTKSGSMLNFAQFYGPMGLQGKLLGEAFVDWFCAQAPFDEGERHWFYGMTIIGDPIANWATPIVPIKTAPVDGSTFTSYPRKTSLTWTKVTGAMPGEYTYEVQVDFSYQGKWALNSGYQYIKIKVGDTSNFTFNFVGAQPGRWRVRAIRTVGNVSCPWSPWSTFKYTI